MTKKLRLATMLAALGILTVGVFTVYAESASSSTSDVILISNGTTVTGASSTLVRTDDGVTMTFSTSGLDPGAYTVWWAIGEGPNSVLWATGHIVGGDGVGNFAAHLEEGNPPGEVLFGDGLINARDDEVSLVLRFHGVPIPGQIDEQRTEVFGGCPGGANDPDPCENVQFSVHLP